ncbi:MAG: hypothetical protein KJS97_13765 [Alphaproteobacteria bacterium]|nr:hypothetical protein [Alphaproteobacteria bacterium]
MTARVHSFALRIDLVSGLVAARVLKAAPEIDAGTLVQAIVARRRADGDDAGLIAAPAPAAAFADPGAFDAAAKAAGLDPRSIAWDVRDLALDAPRLAALASLRARGWGLTLRTGPGAAPALAGRDRALFGAIVVDGAWRDACACPALAQRLAAAQACGALSVWGGTGAPDDVRALQAHGFDAADVAATPLRQLAVARARSTEQASSFSIR